MVPPMPPGSFVKEEGVVPSMPPNALVKVEVEVVVKEEQRSDRRPKRQRTKRLCMRMKPCGVTLYPES